MCSGNGGSLEERRKFMKLLGTFTSAIASTAVAIVFIYTFGLSVWTLSLGGAGVLLSVLFGRRYDQYAYLARHDDLTECYNRRFIKEKTDVLIRQAQKLGRPLCMTLIDLDDFKKVNDSFGHRHGDSLLKSFSESLMSVCPPEGYVARLGDDEFIMVVPHFNVDNMNQVMQSFHRNLNYKYADVKYSVGIAQFPLNGDSYEALINYAERKMYSMKRFNAQEINEERYVNYIYNNQRKIIEQWYEEMKDSTLSKTIKPYQFHFLFDYVLGLKVAMGRKDIFAALPEFCKYLSDQGVTSDEIRIATTAMRNILIDQHEATFIPFPIHVVKEVIARLDVLESAINHEYTKIELIKRENDITELHEDRLTLIGKMAASMAHEIRNPLTSIKGFLKLIRANITETNPNLERYIQIIESEFENIHMQITGLLSFSKKQIIEESFSYLSANQLLHSMISLLSPRLINENVELNINERDVFYIYGQKVALQQVISNILNNGIDALSMNDDREKIMRIDIYKEEPAACISISNNGPEIPEEVRSVLFRPFTTTKEDGTGLGLAICKQIMEKNNGDITFESNAEETTFTLIFYNDAKVENPTYRQTASAPEA